jgi:type II secretory pathway pseudopilin PulG
MLNKNKIGFSLIELVFVIVISLILASLALITFRNFAPAANLAAEKQTVASIKTGISLYYLDPERGNLISFPPQLDTAEAGSLASAANPFFDLVLSDPVTSGWQKVGANSWEAVSSGNCYEYDAGVAGLFWQVGTPGTTTTTTSSTTTTRTTTTTSMTTTTRTSTTTTTIRTTTSTSTTRVTAPTSTITTTTGLPVTTTTTATTSSTAVAAPRVQTSPATGISSSGATLNLTYNFGGAGSGSVQFRYKKSTDAAWTYTGWAAASGSGAYSSSLSGLTSNSSYYFVARLMYGATQIEGGQLSFTTSP